MKNKQNKRQTANQGANAFNSRVKAKLARMKAKLTRNCSPYRHEIFAALDELRDWLKDHDRRNQRPGGLGRK